MLIETMDFGEVEISDEDIITFPKGIYGFPDSKEFVLLKNRDNPRIFYLQSACGARPRLLLIDPYLFFDEYSPSLPEDATSVFSTKDASELTIFAVTVIPENIRDMTANLKSPVIIDFHAMIGAQLILENKEYGVRTRLFAPEEAAAEEV